MPRGQARPAPPSEASAGARKAQSRGGKSERPRVHGEGRRESGIVCLVRSAFLKDSKRNDSTTNPTATPHGHTTPPPLNCHKRRLHSTATHSTAPHGPALRHSTGIVQGAAGGLEPHWRCGWLRLGSPRFKRFVASDHAIESLAARQTAGPSSYAPSSSPSPRLRVRCYTVRFSPLHLRFFRPNCCSLVSTTCRHLHFAPSLLALATLTHPPLLRLYLDIVARPSSTSPHRCFARGPCRTDTASTFIHRDPTAFRNLPSDLPARSTFTPVHHHHCAVHNTHFRFRFTVHTKLTPRHLSLQGFASTIVMYM